MTVQHCQAIVYLVVLLTVMPAVKGSLRAATILTLASTSFENETPGSEHEDMNARTIGVDMDEIVDTTNSSGGLVDSTLDSTMAGDLGFDLAWKNSNGSVQGLSDGDFVGVSDFTAHVGTYDDGQQGYRFEDIDGTAVLTFEPVDLGAAVDVTASVAYFLRIGTYETTPFDSLVIEVQTDVGSFSIVDTSPSDIDDLNIEGRWITGDVSIPDTATVATLIVNARNDNNAETMYIDNVKFIGTTPEPNAVALLLMGLGLISASTRPARPSCFRRW